MTPQEYKDRAKANGYALGAKTDAELLIDYAFHKAACAGMEEEVFSSLKDDVRGQALANFHWPHRIRLMRVLDAVDRGKTLTEIWAEVVRPGLKKSEVHDAQGNLIVSKL